MMKKNMIVRTAMAAVVVLCGCALFRREPPPNMLTPEEEVQG